MAATPKQKPTAQAAQPAGAPAAPERGHGKPEDNPKREQGKQVWRHLVAAAMKIIYSEQVTAAILQVLQQSADNPPHGVAMATKFVMEAIARQLRGIDPRVVVSAAPAIASMIFELGNKAGVFKADATMLAPTLKIIAQSMQSGPGHQAAPEAPQAGAPPAGAPPQAPGGLVGGAMQQPMMGG
jgi:hypothetical protein